jgi:hypothetical protein
MQNLITMVTLLTLLGGQPTIAQTKGGVGSSAMPANQIVSSLRAQEVLLIDAPIGRRQPHANDVLSVNGSDLDHVGGRRGRSEAHYLERLLR